MNTDAAAAEVPGIPLANGDLMPAVGLGLWQVPGPQVQDLVPAALAGGYRHLDCACDYGNEAEVGEALQAAMARDGYGRDELWITSKLWNTYHAAEHVRPALERTLSDLQLDHLDLYLIHFPIALRHVPIERRYPPEWLYDPAAADPRMELASVPLQETWGAMEELHHAGLVRHIGVCNYSCTLLRDLLAYATIRPAVLQVERHPYLTQARLLRFCSEQDIAVTAFSPLGGSSYLALDMADPTEPLIRHPTITAIADRHERTPAQILLRWGVQSGTAVIPKTVRPDRLRENHAIADFVLSEEERRTIDSLDRGRRFNDPGAFCAEAFGTFCPIFD